MISNLKTENLETFSVYKFSIEYPPVCRVEFNPKSRREGGDIVFHFPDKEKIYISWGDLEVAKKRFQTPENQAEEGIKRIMRGRTVNMKESQRVPQEPLKVNTHKAVCNRVKLGEMLPGLFFSKKRIVKREAISVHLHCEDTSRYFVIYSLLSPNAPEDFGTLLFTMARSFKCH